MSASARETLLTAAAAAGIVGAGGGGRPVGAGLTARPYRRLIVNAAQSEPLFAKDWAALAHFPDCVFDGARLVVEALGLAQAGIAVREEFLPHLPGLAARARAQGLAVMRLPDRYPLGYAPLLKREVLGVAGEGEAGAETLVLNAETVRNLSWAVRHQRALCTKLLSVAGAVRRPLTLSVPLGTPFADCLALAGGAPEGYALWRDGALSGQRVDPDACWVDAATFGYLVLPPDHPLLALEAQDAAVQRLASRRAEFLRATAAGRTQPMSAACALFGLTAYHRPRPEYQPLRAADARPERLRLVPVPGHGPLEPCVDVGAAVRRGQLVALQPGNAGLRLHASVDGVVETSTSDGVAIVRSVSCGQGVCHASA